MIIPNIVSGIITSNSRCANANISACVRIAAVGEITFCNCSWMKPRKKISSTTGAKTVSVKMLIMKLNVPVPKMLILSICSPKPGISILKLAWMMFIKIEIAIKAM